MSLPLTDTRQIIRTASSLAWRFVDCRFFFPFLAMSSSSFSRFLRRLFHSISVVVRVNYNIATEKREGNKRWHGKGDGKAGGGKTRSYEDSEIESTRERDIK